METASLRAAEVCRRAGVSYRQLDYWGRCGLIPFPFCGPGIPRRWTAEAAERVCAIAAWVHLGVRASRAAALVDAGHTAPTLSASVAS